MASEIQVLGSRFTTEEDGFHVSFNLRDGELWISTHDEERPFGPDLEMIMDDREIQALVEWLADHAYEDERIREAAYSDGYDQGREDGYWDGYEEGAEDTRVKLENEIDELRDEIRELANQSA